MSVDTKRMRLFSLSQLDKIPQINKLNKDQYWALKVVANVLPFRVNNYVLDELIDWDDIPKDPIYQLTFMQKDMLEPQHFERMLETLKSGASKEEIKKVSNEIRLQLNPHPAGQLSANVPVMESEEVSGVQHKYRETALIFPSGGQTCFSYCTFCFRWPQFVGMEDLKFSTDEAKRFLDYIREHKEISDVLVTGGDPVIMSAKKMSVYLEPLLGEGFEHIQNIRIGTKVLAYWPYRFTTDKDADDYLRLFEKISESGKHLAFMAHFNHDRELQTPALEQAVKRLRSSGVEIRTQSPVLRRINDRSEIWARMWKRQVQLGMIPYYMFVERDTGPKQYFEIPLEKALRIYRNAIQQVSGLARTARGPSMSCLPGKVAVEGVAEIKGEKVFVLSMLQGRNNDWVKRPFFAKYDPKASWLDDLEPAFGEDEFFFETELNRLINARLAKVKMKEIDSESAQTA